MDQYISFPLTPTLQFYFNLAEENEMLASFNLLNISKQMLTRPQSYLLLVDSRYKGARQLARGATGEESEAGGWEKIGLLLSGESCRHV